MGANNLNWELKNEPLSFFHYLTRQHMINSFSFYTDGIPVFVCKNSDTNDLMDDCACEDTHNVHQFFPMDNCM